MLQPVIWDRLPGNGGAQIHPVLRAYARVAIQCAEAHGDLLVVLHLATEESRAAARAEQLRLADRRGEGADRLLPLKKAEPCPWDAGIDR